MTNQPVTPTFLVAGAARSGTASLREWFRRHPRVFVPEGVGEIGYFSQPPPTAPTQMRSPPVRTNDGLWEQRTVSPQLTWEAYLSLFDRGAGVAARGEISPAYLYFPGMAAKIRQALPECHIVMILRDPVDRAISHLRVRAQTGEANLSLASPPATDVDRCRPGFDWATDFRGTGQYSARVQEYLDAFGHDHVGIWLFEDLRAHPAHVLGEICRFLGVDYPDPEISFVRENASSDLVPTGLLAMKGTMPLAFRLYRRLVTTRATRWIDQPLSRVLTSRPIVVDEATRRDLVEFYQPEVERLQPIIPDVDLSGWKSSRSA